jgi:5'-nucleotidase
MAGVLLTNDDGVDSPALAPFAVALAELGPVTVVAPDRERSWISKAITRVGEISLARVERDGVAMTACSGYPADATQLGIHVVCDPPPDLVVSGINLGLNHGTAFMLSSGTVGAAIEGWISGLPAVAFSTGASAGPHDEWREHVTGPGRADAWRRLSGTCVDILRDLWRSGLLGSADVVSVNVPFDATADTPRRVTTLARVRYGGLFDAVGPDRYRHAFVDVTGPERLAGTDVEAFQEGVVSITPIRMPEAVDVPGAVRARVERRRAPRR